MLSQVYVIAGKLNLENVSEIFRILQFYLHVI